MYKFFDEFVNQYKLSKTLRFELIPQGRTLNNFEKNMVLSEDLKRAESYKAVKGIIDDYHRAYIEKCSQIAITS